MSSLAWSHRLTLSNVLERFMIIIDDKIHKRKEKQNLSVDLQYVSYFVSLESFCTIGAHRNFKIFE